MNRYELKTTLRRSNPQVIRQFEISGDSTAEKLLETTAVVHGWDRNTPLSLFCDDREMEQTASLDELFSAGTVNGNWEIRWPMSVQDHGEHSILDVLNNDFWVFRLDLLKVWKEQEEGTPKHPCLIRYRGINPPLESASMYHCNWKMLGIEDRLEFYYGWKLKDKDQYTVKPEKINRKLELMDQQMDDYIVRLEAGRPLLTILERQTVDSLKYMLTSNDIPITYQGRKAYMVNRIIDWFDRPDFWEQILEKMDMVEYQDFKTFCNSRSQSENLRDCMLPTLQRYNLIAYTGWEKVVPEELLRYYAEKMEDEGDEKLLQQKRFCSAVMVGLKLYCLFHKDVLKTLYEVMNPDQKDFEELWKELCEPLMKKKMKDGWGIFDKDIIYSTLEVTPQIASREALSRKDLSRYYIPDRKEALSILVDGLTFSKKAEQMLMDALDEEMTPDYWYSSADTGMMIGEIYYMIHLGYKDESVIDTLKEEYHWEFKNSKFRKLRPVLAECRREVRIASNYGYTEAEAQARNRQQMRADNQKVWAEVKQTPVVTEQRIYPNDLCPCGSGLKYKHCHGKYKK